MFIQIEQTKNPSRLKFLPGRTVLPSGTAGFLDAASAAQSPLAQLLFKIDGIKNVYFDQQSVTLIKADDIEWAMIKPIVLGTIMEHFATGRPVILENEPLPKPGLVFKDAGRRLFQ